MRDSSPEPSSPERNAPADYAAWARGLRYFRICRSRGGLGDDNGDSLLVALAIASEQDLVQTLAALGIVAERIAPNTPLPEPNVAYTGEQWAAFVTPIKKYPAYKQPGHVVLAGRKAFVWVLADRLEISVLDEAHPYDVTQTSVQAAQAIETLLPPLAHKLIDPPRDAELCF